MNKNLPKIVDELYATRAQRLEVNKRVDALKATEKELREYLIDELEKGEAAGIAGKSAKAFVKTATVPKIEDVEALVRYALKTKQLDLLSVGVSAPAVCARWEAQEQAYDKLVNTTTSSGPEGMLTLANQNEIYNTIANQNAVS